MLTKAAVLSWRLQAIAWTNVEPDLCHHMASLGHNELIQKYCLIGDGVYALCNGHCVCSASQGMLLLNYHDVDTPGMSYYIIVMLLHMSLIANGSPAFIWKLHWYWQKDCQWYHGACITLIRHGPCSCRVFLKLQHMQHRSLNSLLPGPRFQHRLNMHRRNISGACFNIKMLFYQHGIVEILWTSYLHNWIWYTNKMASIYSVRPLKFEIIFISILLYWVCLLINRYWSRKEHGARKVRGHYLNKAIYKATCNSKKLWKKSEYND